MYSGISTLKNRPLHFQKVAELHQVSLLWGLLRTEYSHFRERVRKLVEVFSIIRMRK